MPTCLGKNSLLCVSFVTIYQFACVVHAFFGFEGGAWYLIVLASDHCLSFLVSRTAKIEQTQSQ